MRHALAISVLVATICHGFVLFYVKLPVRPPVPAEKTYLDVTLAVSAPSVETPAPSVLSLRPEGSPEPPPPLPPNEFKTAQPPLPPPQTEIVSSPEPKPPMPAHLPESEVVEPPPLPAKADPPKSPALEATASTEAQSPPAGPESPIVDVVSDSALPSDGMQAQSENMNQPAESKNGSAGSSYHDIEQPYYLKRGRPVYPAEAKRLKQDGVVVLALFINQSGELDKVEVVHSSGFPLLDQAAVAAERRSRFRPAYLNGRPIRCRAEVPYRFVLPE
jgi:periplasmic protein TonB